MLNIITLPTEYVILGKTELNKDKFTPIQNKVGFIKPTGGLWASPYTPDSEYVSAWHEWCRTDGDGCSFTDKHLNNAIILRIKEDALFWVIDDQQGLIDLIDIVGKQENEITKICDFQTYPDFENAAKTFDVIYLTEKGQWETRLPDYRCSYNLYGWDCESILIMNFDCIESWKSFEITVEDIC